MDREGGLDSDALKLKAALDFLLSFYRGSRFVFSIRRDSPKKKSETHASTQNSLPRFNYVFGALDEHESTRR